LLLHFSAEHNCIRQFSDPRPPGALGAQAETASAVSNSMAARTAFRFMLLSIPRYHPLSQFLFDLRRKTSWIPSVLPLSSAGTLPIYHAHLHFSIRFHNVNKFLSFFCVFIVQFKK